ncbi:MAG: argininosuccinate lyase [Candidatus Ratteibacteria bacterium]|nr:argininosuccinate lyase [Candidatus Ratteibacteria bacterium]
MAKLWQKDYRLLKEIGEFTSGEDSMLDNELVEADVLSNIAHVEMLNSISMLSAKEAAELKKGLKEILKLHKEGNFKIHCSEEDVHTAIENYLTKKYGDVGQKIHVGRSRNDQVISDLRIYSKAKLLLLGEPLLDLIETLLKFAEKSKDVPMVGYTHSRKAMPSSVGLWAGAFVESLVDDLRLLRTAYILNNRSPLGSAASYGVDLEINRELLRELLGFEKIQNNLLYVNNSRGKIESIILFALTQVMLDLAKLSEDIILFTREEFGYFTLPNEVLLGSSIMPQKKNPDVLEQIRARYVQVESGLFMVLNILKGLPSGYNGDLQLTKEPLIRGFKITELSLKVMDIIISKLKINESNLIKGFSKEVFAADEATRLAKGEFSSRVKSANKGGKNK